MIICFLCDPETKRALDELVRKGAYSNYSGVIAAAVSNLTVLEQAVSDSGGAVVLSEGGVNRSGAVATEGEAQRSGVVTELAARRDAKRPLLDQEASRCSSTDAPQIFTAAALPAETPSGLASFTEADISHDPREVPLDRWVFGQFNKLLPAKATCRALANLARDEGEGFELDKVSARISADAARLGGYLTEIDRRAGFVRDEALALGFPSNRERSDRSRLRYATQFVGSMTKDGRLWGLLSDFKLIGLIDGRRIHLTDWGWKFGMLPNPVLDAGAAQRFSDEEIQWLIDHIKTRVPAEDCAYRVVLRAIRAGADTPEKLDQICQRHVSLERSGDLSDAFITTQRTGVVSRLNELRLIGRAREGVRVTYFVTEAGDRYLERVAA